MQALSAVAAGTLIALSVPAGANAHVRVDPGQAQAGSYTVLTVRVPNESATAGTVALEVALPTDTPFTSVSYEPVPGWNAAVVRGELPKPVTINGAEITEAPLKVVWTAEPGTQVGPGEFQRFTLSVGPVPDTGSVLLPATQTYSDGEVVEWNEPASDDGEPEHPAPILYINDAPPSDDHHGGAAGGAGDGATDGASVTAAPHTDGAATHATTDPLAIGVALGALALAGLGVVLAAFALARGGRKNS